MGKKKIENRYFSRRQFLIGSGKAVFALPPLLSMMPSEVLAQVAGKKVRVITGVSKYGIDPDPRFPAESIQLEQFTQALHTYYRSLSALNKKVCHMVDFDHAAFRGLENDVNLIRGLNLVSETGNYFQGSHGFTVLSGTFQGSENPKYGASIDTIIEHKLGVRALRLKSDTRDNKVTGFSFWRPNSNSNFQQSNHIFGDKKLFNTLFPNGTTQANSSGGGPSKGELLIDQVLEDLNRLLNHKRISSEDKNKLDEYTTSVHEVQKRIIASSSQTVTCNQANINFEEDKSSIDYEKLYENYSDLIVLAFQCDQARVIHMANSAISKSFTGDGASNNVHHKSNSNGNQQAEKKIFFLHQMAKLAQKLKSTNDPFDPGNSLLHNSIMLWTADLGTWNTSHSITQIPAITFGAGGGYFNSGYFVDYRVKPVVGIRGGTGHPLGRPYKQLLISMMKAAGLEESQYNSFGSGKGYFGEFGIQLSSENIPNGNQIWSSEHNNPLPFLSNG